MYFIIINIYNFAILGKTLSEHMTKCHMIFPYIADAVKNYILNIYLPYHKGLLAQRVNLVVARSPV